jgi:multiple antibiotic resistance protein
MPEKFITDFFILWATIDPIGTMALYTAITSELSPEQKKKTALKSMIYSAIVLLGALVLGQIILSALGIRLVSLQIAGGIILFLLGIQMVFGMSFQRSCEPEPGHDLAIFPLAVPSTASPGAITAIILITDNYQFSIPSQIQTALTMLFVLAITYLLMIGAAKILRVLGTNGSAILVRVMGLILAALSVELVMKAVGY